jgi:hypothetical protein
VHRPRYQEKALVLPVSPLSIFANQESDSE